MVSPWTPNQAHKRQLLIDAAAAVMRQGGVAACTVRAIADESALSSGLLHYYFDDVEELVDLAFRQIFDEVIAHFEAGSEASNDPVATLWDSLATYLGEPETPGFVRTPMLWFEYLTTSARRADTTAMLAITRRLIEVFRQLLAAAGVDDADIKGDTLYAAALGTAAQAALDPMDVETTLDEFATALGIPRRRSTPLEVRPGEDRTLRRLRRRSHG